MFPVYALLLISLQAFPSVSALGAVNDVQLTPMKYQETSSVLVSWNAPNNTGSTTALKYTLTYCEINRPQTCILLNTTALSQEVTGLKKPMIYSFTVQTFAGSVAGNLSEVFFRLPVERDTCREGYFTCTNSPQCVFKNVTCNMMQDCSDNSDEKIEAGCNAPFEKPTNLRLTSRTTDSLRVTFDAINNRPQDRTTGYEILLTNNSMSQQLSHNMGFNLPKTADFFGLEAGSVYGFQARARNPTGDGPWTDVFYTSTEPLSELGAVNDVQLTPIKYQETSSVLVSWNAPNNTGSTTALKYTLTYCEINRPKTCILLNTTALSQEVTGLKKPMIYSFTVQTFAGNVAGNLSEVFFRLPVERDTCREGYFTCTNSPQCVFKNVTCNMMQDCSDNSDEKIEAGCNAPFEKPTNLRLTSRTTNSLRVTFDAINNRPQDRTTGYEILLTNNSMSQQLSHNMGFNLPKTANFFGLKAESVYGFQARARNPTGDGLWTDVFYTSTEPLAALDAVNDLKMTPVKYQETSSVLVSWGAPNNTNNATALNYTLTYCEINRPQTCKTHNISITSWKIEGLSNRMIYQITVTPFTDAIRGVEKTDFHQPSWRVTCKNGFFTCTQSPQCIREDQTCNNIQDCADNSDEKLAAQCKAPLHTPNSLRFSEITANSMIVTFDAINNKPEDRINQYEVQLLNTSLSQKASHKFGFNPPKAIHFFGLVPGSLYAFRARALNPTGEGKWNEVRYSSTKPGKIGPVVENVATPKQHTEDDVILLSWKPPSVLIGYFPVQLKYLVRYTCNGNGCLRNETLIKTSSLNVEISSLQANSVYEYTIQALYGDVEGEVKPGLFKTAERRTCDPGHEFTCIPSQVCVNRSVLCDGRFDCSDKSDEISAANCSVPAFTPEVAFVNNSVSRQLTFTLQTTNDTSQRITAYSMKNLQTGSVKQVLAETGKPSLQITFYGLGSQTEYKFQARAENPSGSGPWGEVLTATTNPAENIGKVMNATVTPVLHQERHSARVEWKVPSEVNEEDPSTFSYVVKYCEINREHTCLNASTRGLSLVINALKGDMIYLIRLYAVDEQKVKGGLDEIVYRTARINTCNSSTHFTCAEDKGCVLWGRTCDNIFNCQDRSDESLVAKCSLPLSKPLVTEVKETSTNGTVKVTWARIMDQSQRIRAYKADLLDQGTYRIVASPRYSPSVTSFSAQFPDLLPNTEYWVRVRAVNPSGEGPWSEVAKVTTRKADVELIGPVENGHLTPVLNSESTQVNLTWSPPTDPGRNKLVYYRVNLCDLNRKCSNFSPRLKQTFYHLKNLIAGHLYQYKVYAYNENDETDPQVFLTDAITMPKRDTCKSDEWACMETPRCIARWKRCNNLPDCTDQSDESLDADCELPPSVVLSKSTVSETSIAVTFAAIKQQKHRIRSYEVQSLNSNQMKTVNQPPMTAVLPPYVVTFTGLLKATNYSFKARAVNPSGRGAWSNLLIVTTLGVVSSDVTTTTTRTSTVKSTPQPTTSSDGLTGGEVAGIVIGVILLIVLIVIFVVVLVKRSKAGKANMSRSNMEMK